MKLIKVFTLLVLISIIVISYTYAKSSTTKPSNVRIVKTSKNVWKMLVNNKPYFIKGLEYSADIVGKGGPEPNSWMWCDINHNGKADGPYDSWVDLNRNNFQDDIEYAVGDFALMKAMGCNTIRIYHGTNINKDVLRDLYKNYGIMVIIGNYLGAYTRGSEAQWSSGTDYLDKTQRHNMLKDVINMVEEHKDEPYVLMWMLGNENDSPGSTLNSTKTNTNAPKYPEEYAKFVEEVCKEINKIDPNHPVGVCNATTKFLKYYAQYSPSIDVFGINQYTGPYGFGTLWNRVKKELNKPVLITEYGCDAYNSKKNTTCEQYQAEYHRTAWKDIENNGYWGSGAGNSIGGIVYCWLDKWWLAGSVKEHDTILGAWRGATIDGFFNDEWLGICAQGKGNHSPFMRQLRNVYYLYQQELWDWDPATY